MKTSGYYRRRRGILEHLEDGRMSLLDNSFHDVLCQLAGHGTGVAYTSAARLARRFNLSRQLVHKYLIRLERGRYIRRFRKARSAATQIIWIHRYECTGLPQKGKVLNAWGSDDCRFPAYEAVDSRVDSGVDSEVDTGRLYPYVQEVNKVIRKKKPAANPAAPPLPSQVTEKEQRRRIGERDTRLARARETYSDVYVGSGPSDDPRLWNRQPKDSQVDTAVDSGATQNAQSIARARDIDIAAPATASAGSVDRAAPQSPMSITRAQESRDATNNGLQRKPGPQAIDGMSKAEIDAELRELKAKLANIGNIH